MDKLTQDELDRFRAAHTEIRNLRNALADAEVQIHNSKIEKQSVLSQLDVVGATHVNIQKELHDKYGEITINFSTGEITKKDGNS
jgi:uncharacterized protein with HEPN domain